MPTRSLIALLALALPSAAAAFCGFYVGGADSNLVNTATQVVMMRQGTTTVLSLQNDYQGPPKDFALVVPVPVVVTQSQVKTLPHDIFARVDRLAAPRLVEYWEQDPCWQPNALDGSGMAFGVGGMGLRGTGSGGAGGFGVTVEAQFAVGEYEIVVLGAKEAAGLDAWLRKNGYAIPAKAPALLAPYVAQGMKFFVAKVNPRKVRFEGGRALLSPLRISYESKDFRLPVRLGLINSSGAQDLIVHVLAREQRYAAANYPNVTIPTNLDVVEGVRDRFSEFYAALFDQTLAKHPGAVVTEYAWQSSKCDPCPGPVLSSSDLFTLGADVLPDATEMGYTVKPSKAVIRGSLDRALIRRVTRRHTRALQYCVERAAARKPVEPGALTLSYIIDPQGRVAQTTVKTGIGRPEIERCMARQVSRWRFPAPKGGGVVMVDQPIQIALGERRMRRFASNNMVLTRMHYRYSPGDLGEDLVFAPAEAIDGGREVPDGQGQLSSEAQPSPQNFFQARYAIRHPWTGPIACKAPVRGRWGGPPNGESAVKPALDLAQAKRGALALDTMLATPR